MIITIPDGSCLPQTNYMVALFPLTQPQLDHAGNAINIRCGNDCNGIYSTLNYLPIGSVPFPTAVFSAASGSLLKAAIAPITVNQFTISAFIYISCEICIDDQLLPLFYATGGSQHPKVIAVSAAGRVQFHYTNGDGSHTTDFATGPPIGSGTWVFVSIVYDGSTIHTWLNAQMIGPVMPVTPAPSLEIDGVFIGFHNVPGTSIAGVFEGEMGCFSIFSTALTMEELLKLKQSCDAFLGTIRKFYAKAT